MMENEASHLPTTGVVWSGFKDTQIDEMVETTYSSMKTDKEVMGFLTLA